MASGVGVGNKECCNCYRSRLRTARDAVVDTGYRGWLRTTNSAFCGTWLGGGYTECCDATGVC